MDRRVLKYNVAAALLSAAFLIGINSVDAYTYNGGTTTIDKVTEDENELVITGGGDISCTEIVNPQKIKNGKLKGYMLNDNVDWIKAQATYGEWNGTYNLTDDTKEYIIENIAKINNENQTIQDGDWYFGVDSSGDLYAEYDIDLGQDEPMYVAWYFTSNMYTKLYEVENLGDASIAVSNNSTLTSKGNVQTSKAINVTGNSFLKAAGSITGGDVYSDKAIVSSVKDSGESVLASGNIIATGSLKSDYYIGAWSGAVSGKTVYSGGDVVSANSIQAGGLAKGNTLNVTAINAASASITGNQSISGVFTATGKSMLNGGVALGNKKISSLSAGTLSATSTEAVNGAQLNTIKQKLTSAGKTYSAGSDVAISSASAISVTKKGVVDKGDTGIVTGGTVYKITSALNSSLDTLKASVSAHQSSLTTLTQGLSDLKASVTNINQSVASATKSLSSQLNNRLQSDMGNLSDDGKNVIRNMVSSTLKSMNSMSSSDNNQSPVATYEMNGKASCNTASQVTKDDTSTIQNELNSKANTSEVASLNEVVTSNTKQLTVNAKSIHANEASIANLKEIKADVTGSNIEIGKYAEKLGIGKVEAGNKELVTGETVQTALDKKADVSYVDSGLGMMSSQIDAMSQELTRDMNRMGAGAAALAGLHPTSYDASDKLSFAYGGGHYKNANTSALGAFYHPNDKTMVSVAGTIGNADAMLSAGVSIKLGLNHDVKQVMITPKIFSAQEVTNQGMKDQLDSQSEELKQIEAALQSMVR